MSKKRFVYNKKNKAFNIILISIVLLILTLIMQLILFRTNICHKWVSVGSSALIAPIDQNKDKISILSTTQLEKYGYSDSSNTQKHHFYPLITGSINTDSASDFFCKKRLVKGRKVLISNPLGSTDVWKGYFVSGRGVVRDTFNRVIHGAMSPTGSNLTTLLILGKSPVALSYNKHLYKTTGTLHLFVISGFHLGYISNFISNLLSGLFNRKTVIVLTLALISMYFYLVGFSPGLFRAFLMFVISSFLLLFQRQKQALVVIFLMLIVTIIVDISILNSISYQLSFLAISGIYLWKDDYSRFQKGGLMTKYKKNGYISLLFFKLLSSMLFSLMVLSLLLPLVAYYFHEVSIVSVLATALVGWSIPIILKHTLYVSPILFFNIPILSQIILIPIDVLINFINLLLKNLDFAWSTIQIPSFSLLVLLSYYTAYLLIYSVKTLYLYINKRRVYETDYCFF
jgi:competence protein ComEC